MLISALFISSWVPGSAHRRILLRLFGAEIGRGVAIKPGVQIKFPWRLTIGEDSWIGEGVWIDNLTQVTIEANCCLSQGTYLCTGSHDWSSPTFTLITKPIVIREGAWIAARSTVAPGVVVGECAVLGLGSVAIDDLKPWTVYYGIPAKQVGTRTISQLGMQMEGDAENTKKTKGAGIYN